MKYVVFQGYGGEQEIFTFPESIQHLDFAESITRISHGRYRPISGGFVIGGECSGESVSLSMKSRGNVDTELLKESWGVSA